MCSIFGAVGPNVDLRVLNQVREKARDRGRDGGRMETYNLGDGRLAFLGNWRAAPTTEIEHGELQPYDGLVHNGTIANDKELGGLPGEIDSQVLARCLDRKNVYTFAESLNKVKGSYAIGCVKTGSSGLLLACNYKPIHLWADGRGNTYFSSMARHFKGLLPFGQGACQLRPYTAIDLTTTEAVAIPRKCVERAIVVCSAGLDSTVVAAHLVAEGYEVRLLHFRYGCLAESRESALIPKIAEKLGCDYAFVDLPRYASGSSRLFGNPDEISGVEGAEYAHEWVPARNLLMLSTAVAYAEANGYHYVALGNNLEESGAYPDNEEQMMVALNAAMPYAVQNGYGMQVIQPVGHLMKHEIVKLGLECGAPFRHTWSCYRGGNVHCGECGPCFMRATAFRRNGAKDPVMPDDTDTPVHQGHQEQSHATRPGPLEHREGF